MGVVAVVVAAAVAVAVVGLVAGLVYYPLEQLIGAMISITINKKGFVNEASKPQKRLSEDLKGQQ